MEIEIISNYYNNTSIWSILKYPGVFSTAPLIKTHCWETARTDWPGLSLDSRPGKTSFPLAETDAGQLMPVLDTSVLLITQFSISSEKVQSHCSDNSSECCDRLFLVTISIFSLHPAGRSSQKNVRIKFPTFVLST